MTHLWWWRTSNICYQTTAQMIPSTLDTTSNIWGQNQSLQKPASCKYLVQGYLAGGAGYVLSREALRRFVEIGLDNSNNKSLCYQQDDGDEDVRLGGCMRKLNVSRGDSRDELKLKRFFPFEPRDQIIPKSGRKDWAYELYTQYKEVISRFFWSFTTLIFCLQKNGTACCSDTAISFHYIDPKMMYVMYYLIYHLRYFSYQIFLKLFYSRPLNIHSVPDQEFLSNVTFP